MIPRLLEKAILNGWASYQTISHAFSSFGAIPIPNNSTVIITHVKWFPFINPYQTFLGSGANITTWRDLFRYNEYQLKIDGKKSKNFLQFRNEFDYKFFGEALNATIEGVIDTDISMTENVNEVMSVNESGDFVGNWDPVTGDIFASTSNTGNNPITGTNTFTGTNIGSFAATLAGAGINLDDIIDFELLKNKFLFLQKAPIQQDVYFVCEEYIKLSITRNAYVHNIDTIYGTLQPVADESVAPSGLKDSNLLLRAKMQSATPKTQYYYPGTIKNDGNNIPTEDRRMESYIQDIDKDKSIISNIKTSTADLVASFPYQTTPLVEFGVVVINNKHFDKIANQ